MPTSKNTFNEEKTRYSKEEQYKIDQILRFSVRSPLRNPYVQDLITEKNRKIFQMQDKAKFSQNSQNFYSNVMKSSTNSVSPGQTKHLIYRNKGSSLAGLKPIRKNILINRSSLSGSITL